MAERYGFVASVRQFRSQLSAWGDDKKIKTDEMHFIACQSVYRRHSGKGPCRFIVRGKRVDPAKISRFISAHENLNFEQPITEKPAHVSYETESDEEPGFFENANSQDANDLTRIQAMPNDLGVDRNLTYEMHYGQCERIAPEYPEDPDFGEQSNDLELPDTSDEIVLPIEEVPIEDGELQDTSECYVPEYGHKSCELHDTNEPTQQEWRDEFDENAHMRLIMERFPSLTIEELLSQEEKRDLQYISTVFPNASHSTDAEPLPDSFQFRDPQQILRRRQDHCFICNHCSVPGLIKPNCLNEGCESTNNRLDIRYQEATERSLRRRLTFLYATPEADMFLKISTANEYACHLYNANRKEVADRIFRTALSTLRQGRNMQERNLIISILDHMAYIQILRGSADYAERIETTISTFANENNVTLSSIHKVRLLRLRGPKMPLEDLRTQFQALFNILTHDIGINGQSIQTKSQDFDNLLLTDIICVIRETLQPRGLVEDIHVHMCQATPIDFSSKDEAEYDIAMELARFESMIGRFQRAERLAEYAFQGVCERWGRTHRWAEQYSKPLSLIRQKKSAVLGRVP